MSLGLRLGSVATLQLAAGFGIQLAVLAILGAREQTDAYVAAQAVPLVVFAVLAGSLQSVWQPRLSVAHDRPEAWRAAQRSAYGQALLLFGASSSLLMATARWWQPGLFPGLDSQQHDLVHRMLLPLLLASLLDGQMVLQTAALRARERFVTGELAFLLATLAALVLVVVVVPGFGIEAVPWILLARSAAACVALFFQVGRVAPSVASGLREAAVWSQLRLIVSSASLERTAPLVDRFWTSQAATGGMTLFGLAHTAATAIAMILERSLYMPAAARMGRLFAAGRHDEVRLAFRRALVRSTLAVAAAGLLLLALEPVWGVVVSPLLGSRPDQAEALWWLLVLLLGHAHAAAAGPASIAVFHALGNARVPAVLGAVGYGVGVALKSAGFLAWGLKGLALAVSVHQLLFVVVLLRAVDSELARCAAPRRPSLLSRPSPGPLAGRRIPGGSDPGRAAARVLPAATSSPQGGGVGSCHGLARAIVFRAGASRRGNR